MKANVKVIGYGLLVIGMLLVGMPAMAQQEQWQSTSSMQTSGSTYSSQVSAVGATAAPSEATTTSASYSPGRPGQPRRSIEYNQEFDDNDTGSPIGDAVLPLMLMAMAFCGVVYYRRKKALS